MTPDDVTQPPEWSYVPEQTVRRGARYPLARLFSHAAATAPDRPAISDGQVTYTFGQLEAGAARVAAALRAAGVKPGARVVVLAEKRSLVALLAGAIWRAGAVYVPLDAENPTARLERMLSPLQPAAILGPAGALDRLNARAPSFTFEALAAHARDAGAERLIDPPPVDEDQAAYIIHTSGSTGVPKGVVISHRSLLDYFFSHNQVMRVGPRSRVFSLSPFHFDVSIEDTLLPLSLGSFVYQFRGMPLGPLMLRVLIQQRITHLVAVSSLLALITQASDDRTAGQLDALEMIMTGAELCDPKVINFWKQRLPGTRVINAYGPTEATIVCLTHTIEQAEPGRAAAYPIGRPLHGVSVRLMGNDGPIDRPGVTGELWVGGSQVMIGYFGQPEATERAVVTVDGTRFYRTGDHCRLDDSGRLEFVGRIDEEVKLSGRRIHLGEIRQLALARQEIRAAAVGLVEVNGRRQIALVAIGDQCDQLLEDISNDLARQLPEYMRPRVLAAARLPQLSSTGKTDQQQLITLLDTACRADPADRYSFTDDGVFRRHDARVVAP